jgi:hypothetical protein
MQLQLSESARLSRVGARGTEGYWFLEKQCVLRHHISQSSNSFSKILVSATKA